MTTLKYSTFVTRPIFGYALAFAIGVFFGVSSLRGLFVAIPYLVLISLCLLAALQNNRDRVFSLLAYIVYAEIYVRAYGRVIPYLTTQYTIIVIIIVLFFKSHQEWRIYSRSFLVLAFYCIMEILDTVRAEDINTTRGIVMQTTTLTAVVLWGAFNFLTPGIINKFLTHVKYASIALCGIMTNIGTVKTTYTLHSSYDTTNGMAPVQLSAYLGFACVVFFWSVMNEKGLTYKIILNVFMLAIVSAYMLLSFSRGGLYFLALMMMLYFAFNTSKVRSYFVLLLIIPAAYLVYLFVIGQTGGLIKQRYAEQGTSGRDILVDIGFKLFDSDPLAGVGTGNFAHEIEVRRLYYSGSGAHNEFIRAAAEHGFLGIISYWGFFAVFFFELLARKGVQREYGIYFAVFFCMITVHNGLKISLQPLLMLLAAATPNLIKVRKKQNVPDSAELAART